MGLPVYLAMTAAEFSACNAPVKNFGYLACHFSAGGTGLSGCPDALPPDAMLVLDDRNPMADHDPERILEQLHDMVQSLRPACLLLDFQRPGSTQAAALAEKINRELSCPVGVSHFYAAYTDGPVLLPPVPPDVPLEKHLAPWKNRQLWLEAALTQQTVTVTGAGAAVAELPAGAIPDSPLADPALCCHYTLRVTETSAVFHLFRTGEDLHRLLEQAQSHGVCQGVGLYQELHGVV